MWLLPNKIGTLIGHETTRHLSYRGAIIIWMLNGIVPIVTMFVWMSLAGSGTVGNRTAEDFIAYFLAVFLVSQIAANPVRMSMSLSILRGDLSAKLLRPINPYWDFLSTKVSYTIVGAPVILFPIFIVALFPHITWSTDLKSITLFGIAVVIAIFIQFNLQFALGCISFWTQKSAFIGSLWESLYFVLSGAFAPLNLFPGNLSFFLTLSPFASMLSFPVLIITTAMTDTELIKGFMLQLVWLGVVSLFRMIIWRTGLARYTAVGA